MISNQYQCNVCRAMIPDSDDFAVRMVFEESDWTTTHAELCNNGEHPEDSERFISLLDREATTIRESTTKTAQIQASSLYHDPTIEPRHSIRTELADLLRNDGRLDHMRARVVRQP